MNLRPYQQRCVNAIRSTLSTQMSTLAVLATGCGKTVIFAHLARDWPGRVLVLAHRDELIRQAAEKLREATGEAPGVEMGESYSDEAPGLVAAPRAVVSSVQTLCRPNRQRRFRPQDFGLLVIDEAHHAVARTYRDVVDYFRQSPGLKVLGVTATPRRADQLAMGQVFESACFDYGIEAAVEDGWLVPVRQQAVVVEGLDFSAVRSVAGDFNEGELERILSEEKVIHAVAAPAAELTGDLPALVFCVSVAHARLMAEVLRRYKKGSAVALDGSTDRQKRREAVAAFKAGDVQYLCNCGLFLEGFDAPTTAAVVMARPTKSLALYTQVLGRGTRPLPGVVDGLADHPAARREAIAASAKPSMLVLDFVGNSGRHKIVTAADVLGGKYGEPVRAYARETAAKEGQATLVGEALERAGDELALLKEIEIERRREAVRARAEFQAREVSPFAGGPGGAAFRSGVATVAGEPATDRQVWYLVKRCGWHRASAAGLSKRQASAVISKHRGEGP